MLDLAFKNILRQKSRTALTIIGILIGIGAVVALGSISEGIESMIEKEMKFLGGTILISSKDSGGMMTGFQGSSITEDDVENLEDFSGVKQVIPFVMRMGRIRIGAGPPSMTIGIKPEDVEFFKSKGTELESGRELEEGDTYKALSGYTYADKRGLIVGDTVEIKEHSFEIVGIIEKTKTDMDNSIIVPLETLMDIYDVEDYRALFVVPEDITEVEYVAEGITDNFEDLEAITSTDIIDQMSEVVDTLRFFTIGIGSIAAIVGGLGVMNTMIMSIMERRKEIGIMKAMGATKKFILTQILLESVIISLIGGTIGIVFGSVGSYSLRFISSGMAVAKVTIELIVGGFLFALVLGLFGGLYPAWKAAKLDPIKAIRHG